jgi:flagellar basal body P-ring formation protein FlgA
MIYKTRQLILHTIVITTLFLFTIYGNISSAAEKQTLTAEEIKQGATDFLFSTLPWEKKQLEIEIFYHGGKITLPSGEKFLIYKGRGGTKNVGRIPITLEIKVDGIFQKRIGINSRVMVSQEVVKTTRQIKKGEIFTTDNIHIETIKTERLLGNTIKNIKDALGYEAVNYLPNGRYLLRRSMKKPALGSKGNKIMILAQRGGMKITTPGILKEDGYKDAMVQVLNIESKKIIYGRLVDSNTVKVNF